MLEVINHSRTDIELDGQIIPYGKSVLFTAIKNKARMGGLISSGKISVIYVNTQEPKKVEDIKSIVNQEDVITLDVTESKLETLTEEVVTIPSTKKRKSKENNSEVENSKSTKGDMNNATD